MWQTRFGRKIHQEPSGIGIYQNRWCRWLTMDDKTFQTAIYRHAPSRAVLKYIQCIQKYIAYNPQPCCLLGLAGGGLVHGLQDTVNIDAIECSDIIIELGKTYFGLSQFKKLNIIHQDCQTYLAESTKTYPYIICDIFENEQFPESCAHVAFFQSMKAHLNSNGTAIFNLATLEERDRIVPLIKEVFGHDVITVAIPKTKNTLIFSGHKGQRKQMFEQLTEAHVVQKVVWEPNLGWIGLV